MSAANGKRKVNDSYDDLFKLSEGVVEDKALIPKYDDLLGRLRDEASKRPGFGTIEDLMAERVAAGYVVIRDREARGIGTEGVEPEDPTKAPGFASERNYREVMAMWFGQATAFQGAQHRAGVPIEGLDEIRKDVERDIASVVKGIVEETLTKPEAKALLAKIGEEFDRRAKEIPVG